MASLKFLAILAVLLVCCAMFGAAMEVGDDMNAPKIRERRQWGWGRPMWGGMGYRPWGGYGGWGRGMGGWGGRGMYGGYGWGR